MTFIRRLSDSIQIFTNPEQQPQETTPTQNQNNFGVANTADLFESPVSNNFDLLQQQIQNPSPIQESTPPEMTVDASNLFLSVATDSPAPNSRLQELQDRLAAVNARIKELKGADGRGTLITLKEKSLELQKAAQEIRAAADNDQAISNSVAATLGGLGMVGLIAGLPIPQIGLGILGTFGLVGYSAADKEKMYKAAAELEKQAGETDLQAEQLRTELDNLLKESESISGKIKEEERRLSQGFDEFTFNSNLVAESPWQDFLPAESVIKNEESPSAVLFNLDIQKLTDDE